MKSDYPSMGSNLVTAARVMSRHLKRLLDQKEMSLSEFIVLRALTHQNGMSLVEISKLSRRSPTQLSAGVKALRKKGLVRGVMSSSDERISHLFLTEAGEQVSKEMSVLRQKNIYAKLGLTPKEVETLRRLTEKIIESDGRL